MGFISTVGGIFGAIGGFISGVAGALSSAVSGFISGVTSLASSIGLGGIVSIASSIAALAIPGIGLAELVNIISLVANVVGLLAKMFGLNETEDEADEIGFKSEVADMKPEDFDNNMVEYNKYLSNYELSEEDRERFEALSEEERLKYKVVGLGIQISGIESELSVTNLAECVRDLSRAELGKEEIVDYVNECVDAGITNLADVTNYLKDAKTEESKETIYGALTTAIGTRYPELSADDIVGKLGDIAEKINNL